MSEKPTPPASSECCESGCDPCVWDIYFDELQEWKDAQASAEETPEINNEEK